MKKIRKAVIPAAGFGTRFLPATKATPKEMLPIVDKPTIQYIVEEALQSGIEEILIISGHAKRAIEDHFDTNPGLEIHLEAHHNDELLKMVRSISEINIHYIRQKHMRGLGDAILCAQSFIDDEPFAVLLGDDVVYNETEPALSQMIDIYNNVNATVLGCQEVPLEKVSAYGIVKGVPAERENVLRVTSMIEKPGIKEAPSRIAVLGRYIITPDVFEILKRTEPGKGGEIQLTDALQTMAAREAVYAYCFKGKRYDVGDKLGFLKATVEYALRRPDLGAPFREYLKEVLTADGRKI
ncbi:UTP--glucose-1-phosphate uridylyltransferase [Megasphaera cerevisiae DSM 20462]|jgi:UTP--glucose-1-phosphate uridylyltransferase|uniref:UTP--glucose-1-phosphate uridylyltransferase n=1 Tax=Megasphaera cerevisiae DSM 20462 TaxID=1122219 RepID=A0A0J6WTG5_9FIRM|nr:UTP--glucose-1-phosphate uridylyltransferase GalU [Megasphaera cerevisiae]KMO86830.1 UTP--glucose-1-phosphate uridylyltransferase [Megasphaera cerevisiae DSM 20462]MCI1750988.1 UTP--glucose-1-phosphate uridylyltransferase GalU [Megasphaera cerevisiae]OKY54229.1 UTP--glucose-1-phosphate uridylyltransferase [Megasphaera cerevisiae]SJZ84943.1 UDP-glucose pyrophosphorylase [Megasphaera cerevisiae DSM 20462]